MEHKKRDNPGYVGHELCSAYREALDTKIDGIRSLIILVVSLSTTIISVVIWVAKMQG